MNKLFNIVKCGYVNNVKSYILYDIAVIVFGVAGGILLKYIVENKDTIINNIMNFLS